MLSRARECWRRKVAFSVLPVMHFFGWWHSREFWEGEGGGGGIAQMYEKIIQDSIFLVCFFFFLIYSVTKMGMQVVHIDVQHIYCLKKEWGTANENHASPSL